jgi:hypothetical protein
LNIKQSNMNQNDTPQDSSSHTPKRRGRPPLYPGRVANNSSEDGLPEGEIRATLILHKAAVEQMKAIAYWDRVLIRDVFQDAVDKHIQDYIKKHGKLEPIPQKK